MSSQSSITMTWTLSTIWVANCCARPFPESCQVRLCRFNSVLSSKHPSMAIACDCNIMWLPGSPGKSWNRKHKSCFATSPQVELCDNPDRLKRLMVKTFFSTSWARSDWVYWTCSNHLGFEIGAPHRRVRGQCKALGDYMETKSECCKGYRRSDHEYWNET